MRERTKDKIRLQHILENIDKAMVWQKNLTEEELQPQSMYFYAMVKCVEIIGEAVYMLTKEFRESHPEVPWVHIANMRHVLVHDYYNINAHTLWQTITNDLPELRPFIVTYLEEAGIADEEKNI